ncbi:MAG: hypothetical protein Q8O40_11830 [Chloroflexota bacterium]|nr:hypothetical protein [Chloroflexota bacterium]
MPQPGELWRVRIRPVEWQCPYCQGWLEDVGCANDGLVVRIVAPVKDTFIHLRRGCNRTIPLPEGWVWYTTREVDGDLVFYTLPYTLFEPLPAQEG